ncbi:TraR/DksA family transcriptional regulator [Celerinatantimonas sp. YJH-8]|uniref:TraR/DksA family transcriptional regulator n=1 Tax=Celerinatantimonas sp. YJH-8 TaxID=3228714 RepID=UPI0038C3ABC5
MEYSHYQVRLENMMATIRKDIIATLLKLPDSKISVTIEDLEYMARADFVDYICAIDSAALEPFRIQLRRIDAALCQYEIGLYGMCSDCEEPIEKQRLEIDPCTQRCEKCEAKHQAKKRQDLFAL